MGGPDVAFSVGRKQGTQGLHTFCRLLPGVVRSSCDEFKGNYKGLEHTGWRTV